MSARNLPVSAQCIKHTKAGTKCKAPKRQGEDYCVRHTPKPKRRHQRSLPMVQNGEAGEPFRISAPIKTLDDCIKEMSRLAAAVFEGTVNAAVASTGMKVLTGLLSAFKTKHELDPTDVGKRALSVAAAFEAAKKMPIEDARRILNERGFDPLFEYIEVHALGIDPDAQGRVESAMTCPAAGLTSSSKQLAN